MQVGPAPICVKSRTVKPSSAWRNMAFSNLSDGVHCFRGFAARFRSRCSIAGNAEADFGIGQMSLQAIFVDLKSTTPPV